MATFPWRRRGNTLFDRPRNSAFNFTVVAVVVGGLVAGALTLDPDARLDALRVVAVVVLSAFPAFLYARFIEARGPAVWNEYVYNLKRLGVDADVNLPLTLDRLGGAAVAPDPRREQNIYVQKFDAHYGTQNRVRWQAGKQAHEEKRSWLKALDAMVPVILATVVVTVGWLAALLPPRVLSGVSDDLVDGLRLGFLGAYVFIMQMLVRRYFQNDLKGTAYLAATARVIVVPILVAVLHAVLTLDEPWEKGLAFLVGIFPLLAFRAINAVVSKSMKGVVPSLESNYPLSDLDGMSIWYEARLLEEGIEDMQSLVTANVVDVMLATRIPVGRIVDWLDQASLYLHMEPVDSSAKRARRKGAVDEEHVPDRWRLRRVGIRCATDLEDVFAPAPDERYWAGAGDRETFLEGLETILPARRGPSVTVSILRSLRRDPVMCFARNWKGCGDPTTEVEPTVDVSDAAVAACSDGGIPPAVVEPLAAAPANGSATADAGPAGGGEAPT